MQEIKNQLEKMFNVTVKDVCKNEVKFNVKEINYVKIMFLNSLIMNQNCDVLMKRSGTGITVIVHEIQ